MSKQTKAKEKINRFGKTLDIVLFSFLYFAALCFLLLLLPVLVKNCSTAAYARDYQVSKQSGCRISLFAFLSLPPSFLIPLSTAFPSLYSWIFCFPRSPSSQPSSHHQPKPRFPIPLREPGDVFHLIQFPVMITREKGLRLRNSKAEWNEMVSEKGTGSSEEERWVGGSWGCVDSCFFFFFFWFFF